MKILIINLERNVERKLFMRQQLENIGYDYEFVAAVDGSQLPLEWQNKASRSDFYNQITGNVGFVSLNEIACFASHYSCWQKCIELNQSILVLEDDVLLLPNFRPALSYLNLLVNKLNYVRLMVLEKHRERQRVTENLLLYTDFPCGGQGYVIIPDAAKKLVKHANKFYSPVDMYLDRWYLHGLRAYCVDPELIVDENMGSSIGVREKIYLPKPKGFTKLVREIVRPYQKLRTLVVGKLNPIIDADQINSIGKL